MDTCDLFCTINPFLLAYLPAFMFALGIATLGTGIGIVLYANFLASHND